MRNKPFPYTQETDQQAACYDRGLKGHKRDLDQPQPQPWGQDCSTFWKLYQTPRHSLRAMEMRRGHRELLGWLSSFSASMHCTLNESWLQNLQVAKPPESVLQTVRAVTGSEVTCLPVASMYSMHLSIKTGIGFSGVTTVVKGTPK